MTLPTVPPDVDTEIDNYESTVTPPTLPQISDEKWDAIVAAVYDAAPTWLQPYIGTAVPIEKTPARPLVRFDIPGLPPIWFNVRTRKWVTSQRVNGRTTPPGYVGFSEPMETLLQALSRARRLRRHMIAVLESQNG